MVNIDALEQEVAVIGDLSREELVARWRKAHDCLPPKGINRPLLERSATWYLQARKLGGLSSSARTALRVTAGHHPCITNPKHVDVKIAPQKRPP